MTDRMTERCDACYFWREPESEHRRNTLEGRRECRRRPPTHQSPMPIASFAQTLPGEGCGEWEPLDGDRVRWVPGRGAPERVREAVTATRAVAYSAREIRVSAFHDDERFVAEASHLAQLLKHGRHADDCYLTVKMLSDGSVKADGSPGCDCGLAAALGRPEI